MATDIKLSIKVEKLTYVYMKGTPFEKKALDEIDLEIKEKRYKKIFIKPVNGEGGYGIIIFHLSKSNKYMHNNIELSEEFLIRIGKKNNYIMQAGIIQDKSITDMYPQSVNTFRIATENIEGNVRIICSALRIGRQGNEVDNASQDGMVLGIDSNSGNCKEFAVTEEGEIFYNHPDTNFIFKNYKSISVYFRVMPFYNIAILFVIMQ